MALKKSITLNRQAFETPVVAEYWVITRIESFKRDNMTRVELSLYETQESSKTEISSVSMINIMIPGMDVTREAAYIHIKTLPNFIDAIDC